MAPVNHIISMILNPLSMGIGLLLATTVLAGRAHRKFSPRTPKWVFGLALASVLWFWIWSTPLMAWCLSHPLEGSYPSFPAESAPAADAIVILGGGASSVTNGILPYPDLSHSADRVWHGVRLYRAGKAPRIVATGRDTTLSTLPLLLDFGVPPDALTLVDGARNTEEESIRLAALLPPGTSILLVTSATHMRRSELLFAHAGFRVIPAPTDHETTVRCADGFKPNWLWPDSLTLFTNCGAFKELYATWAYRHIRGFRPAPAP